MLPLPLHACELVSCDRQDGGEAEQIHHLPERDRENHARQNRSELLSFSSRIGKSDST